MIKIILTLFIISILGLSLNYKIQKEKDCVSAHKIIFIMTMGIVGREDCSTIFIKDDFNEWIDSLKKEDVLK